MADPFIESRIKNLPLFQRFPPQQLELVANAFEVFEVQPNDYIFRQGYPAQGLYLMVDGRALMTQVGPDGIEQTVGEMRANQFIGEQALFKPLTETASLRVIERAIILFLARQRFEAVLAQYPEARLNLNSNFIPVPTASRPVFKGQRTNEMILMRTRRHPWAFLRRAVLPIMIGLALMIIGLFFSVTALSLVFFGVGIVIPGAWIYYLYDGWNDDYVTITDQRVIREENSALNMETNISEVPVSSVHEVNFEIPPEPFSRLFGYGTVKIKTAGQSGSMNLEFIPNPQEMQRVIFNNKLNYQKSIQNQNRDAIRSEIDRVLTEKNGQSSGNSSTIPPAQKQPTQVPFLGTKYTGENGETIYRKHLSVWFAHIIVPVFVTLAGLLIALLGLLGVSVAGLGPIQFVMGFFVALVGGIWFYWSHWDWRNDMYIVGDESIKLIHKRPLWLQDSVDQIVLSRVDNVISDRSGVINAIFDRGDVRLFLVGDDKKQAKVFENVHNPSQVQQEISARRAKAIAKTQQTELQRQHQVITDYLDVYHQRMAELGGANNVPTNPLPPQAAPPYVPPAAPNTPPTYVPPAAPPPNAGQPPQQPPQRDGTRPPRIPRVRRD